MQGIAVKVATQAANGLAGMVHEALDEVADDLEDAPVDHDHRKTTLTLVAAGCFLLGFLCAKARGASF